MDPCHLNPNASAVNAHLNCHKFSPPVEMRYKDGDAEFPYAVSTCEWCGRVKTEKLSQPR